MADERLPRILSPNLGCPQIVSTEGLRENGSDIILAGHKGDSEWGAYHVQAVPSYRGEGGEFSLVLTDAAELGHDELPARFNDVSETRFLISTTLRFSIFEGKAQFWRLRIRTKDELGDSHLRLARDSRRCTLYDLVLCRGDHPVHTVMHALCLRPPSPEVRFIHLTDLHVAARNDLLAQEVNSTVNSNPGSAALRFLNFNDRLRSFIKEANAMADRGELDFVLALGDLIDFVNHGFGASEPGDNNWRVLVEILTGNSDEAERGNPGLRVPIFATTGNHDWRVFPYPPDFSPAIFGLKKQELEQFDYLYADTSEVVGARISAVHSKLVSEGSPILARSWWGSVVGLGLRWLELAWDRLWTRFLALASKTLLGTSVASAGAVWAFVKVFVPRRLVDILSKYLYELTTSKYFKGELAVTLVLAVVIVHFCRNWVGDNLREKITSLIGIESDVSGLWDYFLNINPYFNYAFRLEDCYFLVLDTGHDALTADSFWDNGGKKIQHLKVRDNIIGGAPESMGFFPPNEYYPYSQISWLGAVLDCIRRTHQQLPEMDRLCRIIVGLHAPPANLSTRDRKRADNLLLSQGSPILLRRRWGRFDIHYGTLNHYLSEFFYLCLGFRQSALETPTGPGVDIVLSGHAHWNIDFRLARPKEKSDAAAWNPEVYYGAFSAQVEQQDGNPNRWWGPLILQTAACGPPSKTDPNTPYFRYITIDQRLDIRTLRPRQLHFSAPGALDSGEQNRSGKKQAT